MRRCWLVLYVMVAMLVFYRTDGASHPALAQDSSLKQESRAELEAIVYEFEKAWNSHDMDAFADLFHEDAHWIHWRGGLWEGKQAIHDGHRAIHDTFYRDSRAKVLDIETVDLLAPEVAYVRVRSDMTGDARSPGQTFRYRRSMILTKRNGVWRIARGHNTRIHDDLK